jgi:uncharacterized RDD family membrane protein YckC
MNDGSRPPDPNDLTQPMPRVTPPPPPSRPGAGPGPAYGSVRPGGPYQHRFGNVPAYLLARLAAFAVDVPGIAFVLATFGFNAYDRGLFLIAGRDRAGFDTLALLAIAAALGFSFLCEAIFGTTLGKLLFGLHTRRFDGRHPGVGRVLVRHLLRPLDLLIVGPFLALVTPRHQRLGDLAGGTVVSGSPLRWFAPVAGILLCAAIAFAQITYGGGLTSAIGVAAETGNYGPDAYAQLAALFGLGAAGAAVKPLPSPIPRATPEPAAEATAEPAAEASAEATDEAGAEPAAGAASPAPESTGDETPEPQDSPAIIQQ